MEVHGEIVARFVMKVIDEGPEGVLDSDVDAAFEAIEESEGPIVKAAVAVAIAAVAAERGDPELLNKLASVLGVELEEEAAERPEGDDEGADESEVGEGGAERSEGSGEPHDELEGDGPEAGDSGRGRRAEDRSAAEKRVDARPRYVKVGEVEMTVVEPYGRPGEVYRVKVPELVPVHLLKNEEGAGEDEDG